MIQINQESFFKEKDLIQPSRFHISKMNKFLPNSAIFLQEFCFGKFIFNGFSHYRIYYNFQKMETVKL